ncbi:hypothetical protein T439DRAFT_374006 [Meredithblackwellia eburnea MCA 4105]
MNNNKNNYNNRNEPWLARRVFVAGFPPFCTFSDSDVHAYFGQFGPVEHVQLKLGRCFFFVTFGTEDGAREATRNHVHNFLGYWVDVEYTLGPNACAARASQRGGPPSSSTRPLNFRSRGREHVEELNNANDSSTSWNLREGRRGPATVDGSRWRTRGEREDELLGYGERMRETRFRRDQREFGGDGRRGRRRERQEEEEEEDRDRDKKRLRRALGEEKLPPRTNTGRFTGGKKDGTGGREEVGRGQEVGLGGGHLQDRGPGRALPWSLERGQKQEQHLVKIGRLRTEESYREELELRKTRYLDNQTNDLDPEPKTLTTQSPVSIATAEQESSTVPLHLPLSSRLSSASATAGNYHHDRPLPYLSPVGFADSPKSHSTSGPSSPVPLSRSQSLRSQILQAHSPHSVLAISTTIFRPNLERTLDSKSMLPTAIKASPFCNAPNAIPHSPTPSKLAHHASSLTELLENLPDSRIERSQSYFETPKKDVLLDTEMEIEEHGGGDKKREREGGRATFSPELRTEELQIGNDEGQNFDSFINEHCRLALRNLANGITVQDLARHFEPCGKVVGVSAHRSFEYFRPFTNQTSAQLPRGEGFVEFDDVDAANHALAEMNGRELGGMAMRLSRLITNFEHLNSWATVFIEMSNPDSFINPADGLEPPSKLLDALERNKDKRVGTGLFKKITGDCGNGTAKAKRGKRRRSRSRT